MGWSKSSWPSSGNRSRDVDHAGHKHEAHDLDAAPLAVGTVAEAERVHAELDVDGDNRDADDVHASGGCRNEDHGAGDLGRRGAMPSSTATIECSTAGSRNEGHGAGDLGRRGVAGRCHAGHDKLERRLHFSLVAGHKTWCQRLGQTSCHWPCPHGTRQARTATSFVLNVAPRR